MSKPSLRTLMIVLTLTGACRSHGPIADVTTGSRVRMRATGVEGRGVSGVLAPSGRDSIRVVLAGNSTRGRVGDTVSFATNQVMWMETPRGNRRNGKRGMYTGLATGAVIGSIASAATFDPCRTCFFATTQQEAMLTAALGGGLGGMLVGGIVGKLVVSERWVPAQIAGRAALRVTPRPGGAGASISIHIP